MEARDLTQKSLALRMHVNPSSISRWLSGRGRPGAAACLSLAGALLEPLPSVLAAAGYNTDTSEENTLQPDEEELLFNYRLLTPPLKNMFRVVGREAVSIASSDLSN